MIRLTVEDGKIVQTVTLDVDKVFLGRMASNTVPLTDESVSRKHCLIRRTADGDLEVLDLNSQNGTKRNGRSVDRSSIAVGDELMLGDVRVVLEALEGAPRPKPLPPLPPLDEESGERSRKSKKPGPGEAPAKTRKELISGTRRTTFSEEIYEQLRRTPWWAASFCLHVLLVYAVFQVPFIAEPGDTPFGTINGDLGDDFSSLMEDTFGEKDETETEFEEDLEALPPPVVDDMVPMPTDKPDDPIDDPAEFLPELGPAAADFTSRLNRSDLNTAVSVPDHEFGQKGADGANRAAMDLLRRSLTGSGPSSMGLLKRLRASDVLVVAGHYDRVETILEMMGIRFEVVSVRRLERTEFKGRKVIFVNCTNERPSRGTNSRLREYVKRGGYLLSTDWGIENVLKHAFEGYLRPLMDKGRNVITPNEVIAIRPARGNERHFLLNGTTLGRGTAKWWLEESSYPFRVLKKGSVDVLLESDDLMQRYGASPVAVTFRFGEGRVLHLLGHFYQKEGNLRGTFSTQRLIANFLIAAVRRK